MPHGSELLKHVDFSVGSVSPVDLQIPELQDFTGPISISFSFLNKGTQSILILVNGDDDSALVVPSTPNDNTRNLGPIEYPHSALQMLANSGTQPMVVTAVLHLSESGFVSG